MKKSRLILPSFFLILFLLIVMCAVNPVTGKREFMLYTEQDEIALGQDTDKQIIEQYGLYEDKELEAYINQLGTKMAPNCHRPDLPFHFRVLDTEVINAFAVPGGYIYFTRGILAYLNNEAELAGVMGHELGHVTARHTMKQMSSATVLQLGLGIGAALSENFRQYANLAGFGVQMLFLKFSRDNEYQADALGVEYSTKTGYDSHQMAHFFQTLDRMHPSEDGTLPNWFSTHPNPENRVEKVLALSNDWQQKVTMKNFITNTNPYMNHVNGINFGVDPRHGFVEKNTFYHPTMKFQFAIPTKWQIQNLPTQVQLIEPNQKASLILAVSKSKTVQAAADEFIQSAGVEVSGTHTTQINGLAARRIHTVIPQQQDSVATVSYFIQQPGRVIAFHGICSPSDEKNYVDLFDETINGFKTLSDPKFLNRQPNKLKVLKATQTETLRQTLLSAGVKEDKLEELSLINGKLLTDEIKAGTLYKIIQ